MMLHLGLLSLGECRENGPVARMNERGANLIRGIRVGEEETIEIPLESGW